MLTDEQVRLLMKHRQTSKTLEQAAAKADISVTTARKYLREGKLPSQMKVEHTWRTRPDPFAEVWECFQCWKCIQDWKPKPSLKKFNAVIPVPIKMVN